MERRHRQVGLPSSLDRNQTIELVNQVERLHRIQNTATGTQNLNIVLSSRAIATYQGTETMYFISNPMEIDTDLISALRMIPYLVGSLDESPDVDILQITLPFLAIDFPCLSEESVRRIVLQYGFRIEYLPADGWFAFMRSTSWFGPALEQAYNILNSYPTIQYDQLSWCFLSVTLCLLGKKLYSENAEPWTQSRMNSFTSSLGISEQLVNANYIQPWFSSGLAGVWQKTPIISSLLFSSIFRQRNAEGYHGKLCSIIIDNLRYSQLTNLQMVINIIVGRHLWALLIGLVGRNVHDCLLAVEYFVELGEFAPWVKIIDKSSDHAILNNKGVQEVADVARRIAVASGVRSLANLRTTQAETISTSKIEALLKLANCSKWVWSAIFQNHLLSSNYTENMRFLDELGRDSTMVDEEDPLELNP